MCADYHVWTDCTRSAKVLFSDEKCKPVCETNKYEDFFTDAVYDACDDYDDLKETVEFCGESNDNLMRRSRCEYMCETESLATIPNVKTTCQPYWTTFDIEF